MAHFRRFPMPALCLAAALLLLIPLAAYAYQCNFYSDSRLTYYSGYGSVCSGYGYGCTECWNSDTGEGCAESGFSNCFAEEHQY